MVQKVFIIGATGNVGKALITQILRDDTDARTHKNPTLIVGVASSKGFMYRHSGLDAQEIIGFSERRLPGVQVHNNEAPSLPHPRIPIHGDRIAFVDATSLGKAMLTFHINLIANTDHRIVTANKNPLALCNFTTFQFLTNRVNRYGFTSSVMAGAGAVKWLRNRKDVSDQVSRISGCFSGTNGYICSFLDEARPFSEIVAEAHEKQYTEPHPATDLSGKDVLNKMIILTRAAGVYIHRSRIELKPFISKDYLSEPNVPTFLERLKRLDGMFAEMVLQAKAKGEVLRYVAEADLDGAEAPRITIGLKSVPKESGLGALKGTLNKVVIHTNLYHSSVPWSLEAPGAGVEITASNVRDDLLDQLHYRETYPNIARAARFLRNGLRPSANRVLPYMELPAN